MYGTIAKLIAKPNSVEAFRELEREMDTPSIPGFLFQHVLRSDSNPDELYLVVGFESKDAYLANASSAEQNDRYVKFRELLVADPEWHDGNIVFSSIK